MSAISVTPEELKQQAQVYIQSKEQIEQASQRVNSMNSTIAEEWKGQAFQAYLEQYNQLEQNVLKQIQRKSKIFKGDLSPFFLS